jgi:hypothetical protein
MPFSTSAIFLWLLSATLQVVLVLRERRPTAFRDYLLAHVVRDVALLAVSRSAESYFILYWLSALVTTGLAYRAAWSELPDPPRFIFCLLPIFGALSASVTHGDNAMAALTQSLSVLAAMIGVVFSLALAYLFLIRGVYPSKRAVVIVGGFLLYYSPFMATSVLHLPGWTQQACWIFALCGWFALPTQSLVAANSYTQEKAVALGDVAA